MIHPLYEQFHAWRAQLITELDHLPAGILQALAAELRQAASRADEELRQRQQPADRHDARLYRPKGQP